MTTTTDTARDFLELLDGEAIAHPSYRRKAERLFTELADELNGAA